MDNLLENEILIANFNHRREREREGGGVVMLVLLLLVVLLWPWVLTTTVMVANRPAPPAPNLPVTYPDVFVAILPAPSLAFSPICFLTLVSCCSFPREALQKLFAVI